MSHRNRHPLRTAALVAAALLAAGGLAVVLTPTAQATTTTTLTPVDLTTTTGTVGKDQPVSNLATLDLSGKSDRWNRYVELIGRYSGHLTFAAPAGLNAGALASLRVELNYRGPAASTQPWTLRLYRWSSREWVTVGSNAAAPDWGDWKLLAFDAPGRPADYVSAEHQLRLRLESANDNDAADLDYAALQLVGPGSAPATTAPASARPTTAAPTASPRPSGPSAAPTSRKPASTTPGRTPTAAPPPTVRPGNLPAPVACPDCWHPPLRVSWDWVINVVPKAPFRNVDMYDIDGFDASADDVGALTKAGKNVVCYISAGTYEDWRDDAGRFPSALLGSDLDDWEGERYLDIRDVQRPGSVLAQIMTDRIEMCRTKGFDAVEFDNEDGYGNPTGFDLSPDDQLAYNVFLANAAHARGLSAALKNDSDQIAQLLPYYDMALNEECNTERAGCGAYQAFIRAGKPVFNAEYGSSTAFCSADIAAGINGVRFSLKLNGSVFDPCK
ncbi:endo alpha-1,4 polygalactosaminidase [Dactylosporangium sp. CA-092794]|uniref:endo alpha-1,4 polygalactosaminidase n=1 Tax=Dactylosporangium sp. CA-092794 TaxID=3239929 RepID=UPI003D8BC461